MAERVSRSAGRGLEIHVDVTELLGVFEELTEASLHPGTEVMGAAANDLIDGIQAEFDTAGRGRWQGLSEATLARRRGSEAQILVDTGALRGSLASSDDAEVEAGDDFVEVGTGVEYAVYHVSGAPRTAMPLRNFFDISDEAIDVAMDTILAGILDQSGFKGGRA